MAKNSKPVVTNRQALRDYYIEKAYEAGLELAGNEVKSLRAGKANLKGSFARIEKGEIFVYNMHINPYEYSQEEYDPLRPRKALLHKAQIKQIWTGLSQKGYTLHCLRHTFASELLNAGMRLECLQQLLGHSDIEMTRRYARLTDNTRREEYYKAMESIERGQINGHYRRDSSVS